MITSSPRMKKLHIVPQVQILEDRTAPATFTVLNLNDSGLGSLRQAVLLANVLPGADVIQFAPAVTGSINLTSGRLTIAGDLAIQGPGANALSVSGSDLSRVFGVLVGVHAS